MSLLWPPNWVSAFWSPAQPQGRRRLVNKTRPDSFFEGKKQCDFSELGSFISMEPPPFNKMSHPLIQPTKLNLETSAPYNTNRWWQNLSLENGDGILPMYPYLLSCKDTGVVLSYPVLVPTEDYVISPFVANWTIKWSASSLSRKIVYSDDLGCSLQWGTGELRGYFVRGSPYVTFDVKGLQLEFNTIHAILSMVVTNNRATITFNNSQTWAIYTTSPVAWTQHLNQISMNTPYTGTLRIAMVPAPVESNLPILDQFRASYPIGGSVGYEFPNPSQCYLHFSFKKQGGNMPLLMLSLPHHRECMVNPNSADLKGYRCIKGPMAPVIGDQWTLLEDLCPIQWHSPNPVNPNLRDEIKTALQKDLSIELDPCVKDPYFVGKGIAKLARLILIAESIQEESVIPDLLSKVKRYLEPWLKGENEDKFIYDTTWGGIVTIDAIKDAQADFGNGMYNDHHFHYGYFIYACAIVGKFDSKWLHSFKSPILSLMRDYANPSSQDPYFPKFRVKDFYDGHSWASGLFPFGDGKNQESTSEAVNAYYAIVLLGLALQDSNLSNVGNLLLTTELRSSRTYWHMDSQYDVYPENFAKNRTVGVLWAAKVDYATWFGKEPEFIHCIQMLPFTPISHALLDKPWIQAAYPIVSSALTRAQPVLHHGWRTFIHMSQAVINPQLALTLFKASPQGMDDGNTLTNTLYWFATQN